MEKGWGSGHATCANFPQIYNIRWLKTFCEIYKINEDRKKGMWYIKNKVYTKNVCLMILGNAAGYFGYIVKSEKLKKKIKRSGYLGKN